MNGEIHEDLPQADIAIHWVITIKCTTPANRELNKCLDLRILS